MPSEFATLVSPNPRDNYAVLGIKADNCLQSSNSIIFAFEHVTS